MGQQVKAQIHVGSVHRRLGQIRDDRHDGVDADPPDLVAVDRAGDVGGVNRLVGEAGVGVPDIQHGLAGQGGQTDAAGSRRVEHAP
jgi:hypothetical protein